MIRPLFVAAFLLLFSSAHATPHQITDYVDKILNQFIAIANDQALHSDTKVAKVKPLLLENLDIDWMSKFTLGKHRRELTQEQIANFSNIYKSYIIASYASAIKQYTGQQIKINSVQNISDNEYIVKTSIIKNGQDPLMINYLVRSYPGDVYKVFDVVTEGVSMITSQQAEFSNTITTSGISSLESDLISKTKTFGPTN